MPNTSVYPPAHHITKGRHREQTTIDFRFETPPMSSRRARYIEAQMRSRTIPRRPLMTGIPESLSPPRRKKSPVRDDSDLIDSCRGTPLHGMYLETEQLLLGLEDSPDERSVTLKEALTRLVEAGAAELVRRAKFDEETKRQEESAERRKVREATRRAKEECLMGWSLMHGDSSVLAYTSSSSGGSNGHPRAQIRRSSRRQRARKAA
ncbi:hypothetical protein FOZ63_007134 [Perkinsus olseni]|uniref:Uncharacterized protein n=1 Tax=Perkinsus olseni TaxID=32597 RepID=A0A7J6R2A8_PEROL|nr:hypothetical protein FOZ63_007134 [Perkinsus olseni]KAF4714728.1 hypothetical protein FOZ62_030203 [Perkinsus olseni]